MSKLLIASLGAALLGASPPSSTIDPAGPAQEAVPARVVRYRCPPCSPTCDLQRYAAPGNCGRCGMELVDEESVPSVAVLLFEDCDLLGWAGPASVFASARAFDVYTVADTTDPLLCEGVLEATPRFTFRDAPAPDVIIVGGGHVGGPVSDELVLSWLRESARGARAVLAVGTGTYLAGAAGLLEGKPATTMPESVRWFPELAAKLDLRTEEPIVRAGNVVTARDALSGIEAALELAGEIGGKEGAEEAARRIGRAPVAAAVAR